MKVRNYADLPLEELAEVDAQVGHHRTLQDVLLWGFGQPPQERCPQVIADFVVQDEFSHDVLVPWRNGLWLVYEST